MGVCGLLVGVCCVLFLLYCVFCFVVCCVLVGGYCLLLLFVVGCVSVVMCRLLRVGLSALVRVCHVLFVCCCLLRVV